MVWSLERFTGTMEGSVNGRVIARAEMGGSWVTSQGHGANLEQVAEKFMTPAPVGRLRGVITSPFERGALHTHGADVFGTQWCT